MNVDSYLMRIFDKSKELKSQELSGSIQQKEF